MVEVVLEGNKSCVERRCEWWCGITDAMEEDIWRDANHNTKIDLSYQPWGANEPNGRQYENCIETRFKAFPNRTARYIIWNDTPCENERTFFCEFRNVPVFHLRGLTECQVGLHQVLHCFAGRGVRLQVQVDRDPGGGEGPNPPVFQG